MIEWNRREAVVRSIPIITFHDVVAEGESSLAAVHRSLVVFEHDIDRLDEDGYTTIKFSDLIAYAKFRRLHIPSKSIVITFDDGWIGQFANALPVLKKHGFVATFFINSASVNSKDGYMDWDEVRTLHATGMEIGGHGANHIELSDKLPTTVLLSEITKDKERIEAELGVPIRTFAYPYSTHTTSTIAILKAIGYEGARTGGITDSISLFTLPSWVMEIK